MKYFMSPLLVLAINFVTFCSATENNQIDRMYYSYHRKSAISNIRDASSYLRSVQSGETCQAEVSKLESNPELTSSLDQLMTDLDDTVTNQFEQYCKTVLSETGLLIQCAIDYSEFSSEYLSICSENDGASYSVRFLVMCQTDKMDLEIEYSNLPSCFGTSCSRDNVNKSIALFLNETESAWNEENDGVTCTIIHDDDFEQTIFNVNGAQHENDTTSSTLSSITKDYSDSSKNEGTVLSLALILLAGSMLLL